MINISLCKFNVLTTKIIVQHSTCATAKQMHPLGCLYYRPLQDPCFSLKCLLLWKDSAFRRHSCRQNEAARAVLGLVLMPGHN